LAAYFLNLLEGNFLIFRSELALDIIYVMRKKLMAGDHNLNLEYIKIVNISRIVFYYIIQLVLDKSVKLNGNQIAKFLAVDSGLDVLEEVDIRKSLLTFVYIKKKVFTTERINLKEIFDEKLKDKINCLIF